MSNAEKPQEIGSSPSRGTNLVPDNQGIANDATEHRTDPAQDTAEAEGKVKYPKKVRYRKAEAVIYGKSKSYGFYRVCGYVAGKRRMASFRTYSEALQAAERLVRDIATGSQAAALTARQAADALSALETLDNFYRQTGQRLSLRAAVGDFCEAAVNLRGHTVREAAAGFLATVATLRHTDVGEAVAEFVAARKPLTQAKDGKRPQLNPVYAYNVANWLKEFANTLPGHSVSDLSQASIDAYMQAFGELSSKSRNDRRACLRMFLAWCVDRDYLSQGHRLFKAQSMKREKVDVQDIDFFKAGELRAMLENADKELVPVIALIALGGVRADEVMRLDWADVWATPGYVEVKARAAKTRSRRLIEVNGALAAWLEPYRTCTGSVWGKSVDAWQESFARLRETLGIPSRRNGLRRGFITHHFALHANEGLTAQQAGSSPTMVHQHYKGLATRTQAQAWFDVKPAAPGNVIPMAVADQRATRQ